MKISEVTLEYVKDYINAEHEKDYVINMILKAAKSYITNFTGLEEDELDKYEDITIALLVLCTDFYDQRNFILTENYNGLNVNIIVDNILNMYSKNLL
ncbi:MAG: phage gp6-like head-tail connector protein [Fusobacterium necrophorum]|nr:phage gp6-like head-tail connector protein [Fusobacterium necrophorum]